MRGLENKRLYRDNEQAVLAGVCKGLADYFDMDVSVMRLIWVLVSVFTTGVPTLLIYIIMAIVVPNKTSIKYDSKNDYTIHKDEYEYDKEDYEINDDEYYR